MEERLMRFYLKLFLFGAIILTLLTAGCSKDSEQSIEQILNTSVEQVQGGELAKAEENAKKALNLIEQRYSMVHPALIKPLNILAMIYQKQNKLSEAEQSYERAISILKNTDGENDAAVSQLMNNLATLYYAQEEYEQAVNTYQQSLSFAESCFSDEDPIIQKIKRNIKVCQSVISGEPLPEDFYTADNSVGGDLKNVGSQERGQEPADADSPQVLQKEAEDLLPDEVKQTVINKLAKKNIYVYDLRPMEPISIGSQGAVIPYRCTQKMTEKDEGGIKAILLFATVQNKDKPGFFIFKKCRMVSYDSFMEELNNRALLIKSLKEVFPKVYS